MAKPLLYLTLAAFLITCNVGQGYAQTILAQQPATSTTAALTPSAEFTLFTPDSHRKVVFSLEKDSDGTKTTWKICFILYEKQTGNSTFGDPIISLIVPVAPSLSSNAQAVAQNGPTAPQAAHATGPAADASKALLNGTGSKLAAATSIQNTVR
jgi:hypothetical protein